MLSQRGPDDYDQVGKVSSRGFDTALHYTAPRFFGADLMYAFTVANFDVFASPDPVTGDSRSLSGKHPEFTPRHNAQLWLRFPFTRQVGFGIGGRWVSDQWADQDNRLPMPNYALLDISAWFQRERVSFVVSARNVLDKRDYYTSSINSWAETPKSHLAQDAKSWARCVWPCEVSVRGRGA